MNQNGQSPGSPQPQCSMWIRVFSRIPLALWYPIARFFAFLAWRVIPYRRHVVEANLTKSFPEWDAATRERVIRDYYRGFADMFVEVMHSLRLSPRELARRVTLKNSEARPRRIGARQTGTSAGRAPVQLGVDAARPLDAARRAGGRRLQAAGRQLGGARDAAVCAAASARE